MHLTDKLRYQTQWKSLGSFNFLLASVIVIIRECSSSGVACRFIHLIGSISHWNRGSSPILGNEEAWNWSRRLQLPVWKGCRPLSSSLRIRRDSPPGSCGHHGSAQGRQGLIHGDFTSFQRRSSRIHVYRVHTCVYARTEGTALRIIGL